jgi:hypothetical protein
LTQPNDIETLRQQVQSLTDTVKALQQQVKDQQTALEKMSAGGTLASNAGERHRLRPSGDNGAAALSDEAILRRRSALPPETNAAGSAPHGNDRISDDRCFNLGDDLQHRRWSSLTQPITIGGRKNYMNISFDGLFALAYSSAPDLYNIEVGDHDPQQRGFNARKSSSRSTARSILTSKGSPTSFSSSTTTMKPRSKSKKHSCKRRTFHSICS